MRYTDKMFGVPAKVGWDDARVVETIPFGGCEAVPFMLSPKGQKQLGLDRREFFMIFFGKRMCVVGVDPDPEREFHGDIFMSLHISYPDHFFSIACMTLEKTGLQDGQIFQEEHVWRVIDTVKKVAESAVQ